MGIAFERWQRCIRQKINRDVVLAQGIGMQVQRPLDQFAEIDRAFARVMSRTETITPFTLFSASNSGLAVARMVRQLPSRCRAPYSLKPNFLRPVLTSR